MINFNFLRFVKILVPSQNATMGSSLSPILGQFGVNISQFCKDFNLVSSNYEFDTLINVKLNVMKTKSFTIDLNSITTAFLIFKIIDNKLSDKKEIIIKNEKISANTIISTKSEKKKNFLYLMKRQDFVF